ncbi:MAG: hypothetical protein M1836_001826 [Candelina mexicana]|nr:MAG: hypothetical protein M1836_001826 [Candelina mexicana]
MDCDHLKTDQTEIVPNHDDAPRFQAGTENSKDEQDNEQGGKVAQVTPTPTNQAPLSHLLKLPAEIRIMIWRHLLVVPRLIRILHEGPISWIFSSSLWNIAHRYSHRSTPLHWRLLQTTAQVKAEMAATLYGENTIEICGPSAWGLLFDFLCKIGPTNRAIVRQLVLPIPVECFWFGWSSGRPDQPTGVYAFTEKQLTRDGEIAMESVNLLVQAGNLRKLTLRPRLLGFEIGKSGKIAWRCLNALKEGLKDMEISVIQEREGDGDSIPGEEAATFKWNVIEEQEIRTQRV